MTYKAYKFFAVNYTNFRESINKNSRNLRNSRLIFLMLAELMFLGGAFHRAGGNIAAGHGGLDGVEISRANEGLVLDGAEAHRLFHFKFVLLQLHKSRHAVAGIAVREFEHAGVERVEACQCYELELVTHLS